MWVDFKRKLKSSFHATFTILFQGQISITTLNIFLQL